MRSLKSAVPVLLVVLAGIFLTSFAADSRAGIFSSEQKPLVRIGTESHAADDFTNWWNNWQEEGMEVPQTPEPYVDWLLFVREAENMALYDDHQYQHEVNVYLKVLSLVRLKNEEIDSRIDYSTENLRTFYEEHFAPVWLLNIILYKDRAGAEQALPGLRSGDLTVASLVEASGERTRQEQAKNPHGAAVIDVEALKQSSGKEEQLLGINERVRKRPFNLEPGWHDVVMSMDEGAFSEPISWQESHVILQLIDVFPGDEADFARMKNQVASRYRKYRESVLTNDLIGRLQEKYEVEVDRERIAALDIGDSKTGYSDEPVITFSTLTVSEKELMDKVESDLEFNRKYGFKAEDPAQVIRRVTKGIIAQTLITLESLDRDYEKRPPVKGLFEFYKKNKLVQKLEEQIRSQMAEITDEEVNAYYREHLAEFTSPQVYRMVVLENEDQEVLKKIWLEAVVNGEDIMTAAEERLGFKPQTISYPSNHLSPKIKTMAARLAEGDLSQVFASGNRYAMIYLVESIPSRTPGLDDIRGMIFERIGRERFAAAKKQYLEALRAKYPVDINGETWAKLREEILSDNEKE